MKNWKKTWAIIMAVVYVICSLDSVLTLLEVPFFASRANLLLGNVLSAVFYVPLLVLLVLSWKNWDDQPVRLIRLWASVVLAGTVVLLILMALVTLPALPPVVDTIFTVALVVLHLPTINCSYMILPIFSWAALLIGTNMMLRRMTR